MFVYLESQSDVLSAQHVLARTIRRSFNKTEKRGIGFPGNHVEETTVSTDGKYWYRTADCKGPSVPNPRRLNWFGLYDEDSRYFLAITVEINTAYSGRNDNVAGFFGRDSETGRTYLFHSGRVGGGTKGVGKDAFLAWSNLRPATVFDSSGEPRFGVLVMPVEGKDATRGLLRYIDAIAKFKVAVRAGPLNSPEYKQNQIELNQYYAEARGRRRGQRSGVIDYLSRHGDVVDALYAWRLKQSLGKGGSIVKNMLIDLGVSKKGTLTEVFEVKTSTDRSDVYAAIGQLMVHGKVPECRRFAVLPSDKAIAADLREALERLNIQTLTFTLDESKAVIDKS